MHPRRLRCSSLKYSRYSRSSRLAGGAPRPSRCDARLSQRAARCRRTCGKAGRPKRAGRAELGQVAPVVVGCRQHVEQSLHHGIVVRAGRRLERLLHVVIARDERRVVPPHEVFGLGRRLRLPPAAGRQPAMPRLELGIGVRRQSPTRRPPWVSDRKVFVKSADCRCIQVEEVVDERLVSSSWVNSPSFARMPSSQCCSNRSGKRSSAAVARSTARSTSRSNSGNIASASRARFHCAIDGWLP